MVVNYFENDWDIFFFLRVGMCLSLEMQSRNGKDISGAKLYPLLIQLQIIVILPNVVSLLPSHTPAFHLSGPDRVTEQLFSTVHSQVHITCCPVSCGPES